MGWGVWGWRPLGWRLSGWAWGKGHWDGGCRGGQGLEAVEVKSIGVLGVWVGVW